MAEPDSAVSTPQQGALFRWWPSFQPQIFSVSFLTSENNNLNSPCHGSAAHCSTGSEPTAVVASSRTLTSAQETSSASRAVYTSSTSIPRNTHCFFGQMTHYPDREDATRASVDAPTTSDRASAKQPSLLVASTSAPTVLANSRVCIGEATKGASGGWPQTRGALTTWAAQHPTRTMTNRLRPRLFSMPTGGSLENGLYNCASRLFGLPQLVLPGTVFALQRGHCLFQTFAECDARLPLQSLARGTGIQARELNVT
ncbi:MAG: hypothetical protein JWR01_2893 [Subtercola sp.]|nr:hypothetical protein [Subtercola sp.]